MARSVCLLRGVNVGGKNRLVMAELASLFESLGHRDVATFIQSGNVVFTPVGRVSAAGLQQEIARRFGLEVPVVVRTGGQLTAVLEANPFADVDPDWLHVAFVERPPQADLLAAIEPHPFAPEHFSVVGREIYLSLPHGMGRARLPAFLERRLRATPTIRNWRTVNALAELAND